MKVFAPGKLVLTGAYAVLEGAPALVVATSRGALADSARTALASTIEVRAAIGDVPAPHVDASSLFVGDRKLGLGASAAILVASLGALAAERGADLESDAVRAELLDRARAAHASAQRGGSGIDVAASVHGGTLRYVMGERPARRELPEGTVVSVFACATSARTSDLRASVDALATTHPATHRARLDELAAIARDADAAVAHGDRDGVVGAVRRAARSLAALGAAAGVGIVPAGFEELEALAATAGAAFCVSGAGGGDVAVHIGSAAPTHAFVQRAHALGLFLLDVNLDRKGVRVVSGAPAFTAAAPPAPAR